MLDTTESHKRMQSLVGPAWFAEMLYPYLPELREDEKYFDYHYAEAFCRARDELFPGVHGMYRGPQWGLIVVEPNEVMVYGRPRRAKRIGWSKDKRS